jgi:hypothetical protein
LTAYKELISNTSTDLKEHLQNIDEKLQECALNKSETLATATNDKQAMLEERESANQCLSICAQVAEHIERVEPTIRNVQPTPIMRSRHLLSSGQATSKTLQECKTRFNATATELKEHLRNLDEYLGSSELSTETSSYVQIQEEKKSIEQCLGICAAASGQAEGIRVNVAEDIYTGQASHQVIVATLGDLIQARRVTAGDNSTQWVGQMSDQSLQQLSRNYRSPMNEEVADRSGTPSTSGTTPEFDNRHGAGFKLGH